jgi:hypothetical protein
MNTEEQNAWAGGVFVFVVSRAILSAFSVVAATMVAAIYPLPVVFHESLFWKCWIGGMVFGFGLMFWQWTPSTKPSASTSPDRFWGWCRFVGNGFVWGTGIGSLVFGLLVFSNGALSPDAPRRIDGVVASKTKTSGKGGPRYAINVRRAEDEVVFRCTLFPAEYERIQVGSTHVLFVQRGFFGWPFRVE